MITTYSPFQQVKMIIDEHPTPPAPAPGVTPAATPAALDQGLQDALNNHSNSQMTESTKWKKLQAKYMEKHGSLIKKAAAAAVAG